MKTKSLIFALIMGATVSAFATGNEKEKRHTDSFTVNAEESTVGWQGEKITGKKHNGTVAIKSGSIIMNHGTLVGGEFVIDMNTITDLDMQGESASKLVSHLKSDDFFGVEKYPTSSFKITKVEATQNNTAVQGQRTYNVTGDITVRGKVQSITFPATIIQTGNSLSVNASFEFDRSKHDVKYGSGSFFDSLGDNLIKDMIKIDVKLVAKAG